MEANFSGYATKANLKCSDGRTILPDAFKHQDGVRVPLVWQHGHNDPSNVLGHAVLEHRDDGTYTYGYFNSTDSAKSAQALVEHGDITQLSIYANGLVEKSKAVMHGVIREVSLVLSGANPGARIDNVNLAHGDGSLELLEDEAVIYTGEPLVHAATSSDSTPKPDAPKPEDEETVQDIYDTLTDKQKDIVNVIVGAAIEETRAEMAAQHSGIDTPDSSSSEEPTVTENPAQPVVHSEIQEGTEMTRNLFAQSGTTSSTRPTLEPQQLSAIMHGAVQMGSLRESFLAHAVEYGIEDIDILFPDAKTVTSSPEIIGRRQEWVASVLGDSKHSPFSRIKSTAADLTADEARAKGYVKGTKKKDEIIKLLKRVTTPTTVYKKQKLDRDDIVDITDLDVVAWLKGEMRMMLDEELARAILVGDGRESDDEDKIDEDHLRPIAYDDDMYNHKVTLDANAGPKAFIEAVLRARTAYRGSGSPSLYTTDEVLTDMLLLEDRNGRRIYETMESLAAAMRVRRIETVPVMTDNPDLIAIVVNMADYTVGADKGGQVSMFDDFDIDYNQYKYLIETRISGALTKPKSAITIQRVVGTLVTPVSPSYDGETYTITMPSTTGVDYKVDGVTKTGTLVIAETTEVEAFPQAGYTFPHNVVTTWTFVYTAA